jgi:hypothetical protein
MNVLLITEDFRKDQYIVQPVIQKMLASLGKPNAKGRVCLDPLIGGVSEATKWERIEEVVNMYPMVQVFVLLVDRDGLEGRRIALDNLEQKANALLTVGRTFLSENAWQEIEVWAIAGQDLPSEWKWAEIRTEIHPKERYFESLAAQRKLQNEPGSGRKTLGKEAAMNYTRVRSRCPEDIQVLENRLKNWLVA